MQHLPQSPFLNRKSCCNSQLAVFAYADLICVIVSRVWCISIISFSYAPMNTWKSCQRNQLINKSQINIVHFQWKLPALNFAWANRIQKVGRVLCHKPADALFETQAKSPTKLCLVLMWYFKLEVLRCFEKKTSGVCFAFRSPKGKS